MATSANLEAARRAFRMAEKDLAEVSGQRKIVEEQLENLRTDLAKWAIPEDKIDAHLAHLDMELARIEDELKTVEEVVENKLMAFEA